MGAIPVILIEVFELATGLIARWFKGNAEERAAAEAEARAARDAAKSEREKEMSAHEQRAQKVRDAIAAAKAGKDKSGTVTINIAPGADVSKLEAVLKSIMDGGSGDVKP
jgi:regulator of protease activity HflC (stomatin/prohibitin superfamily)